MAQLIDLGKKWRADSVDVCDGSNEDEDWEFRDYILIRLRGALWGEDFRRDRRDALVISYWWD